jgi:hypothetical protein
MNVCHPRMLPSSDGGAAGEWGDHDPGMRTVTGGSAAPANTAIIL